MLRRVRDFAQVAGLASITEAIAVEAAEALEVDAQGLDRLDRQILRILIEKYQGGPAGLETLAASTGEDSGTLEDVVEPYLMQQGFLARTPRGRVATASAYAHLGIKPPAKATELPLE